MGFKSEEEFLQNYNKEDYERISLTTDILILSVSNSKSDNYRKLGKKFFSVLLVKRDTYPFKDMWCLPGGFLDVGLTLEENARQILKRETNISGIFLEQLYTFGAVNRDPRMRIVSTAYMALIDKEMLSEKLCKNAKWFNVWLDEKDGVLSIVLTSEDEKLEFSVNKTMKEKTTGTCEYQIADKPVLAFDHEIVIAQGIERLKNKIEYTDIVFNMLPPLFTLGELKQVYEVILNKKLLAPAFRRIIASKVEKTTQIQSGGGHRPSVLYRYKTNESI